MFLVSNWRQNFTLRIKNLIIFRIWKVKLTYLAIPFGILKRILELQSLNNKIFNFWSWIKIKYQINFGRRKNHHYTQWCKINLIFLQLESMRIIKWRIKKDKIFLDFKKLLEIKMLSLNGMKILKILKNLTLFWMINILI